MNGAPEITPIQRLVLPVSGGRRDAARAAFALDGECARIARSAREPVMAQIRLAWWRDGLASQDPLPAHRSPMMDALRGVDGFAAIRPGLIAIIDGWEDLILWGGDDRQAMLGGYALGRGGGVFGAIAPEQADLVRPWGQIWALWDLAAALDEEELVSAAIAQGRALADEVANEGFGALPRPLKMLGGAARHDLVRGRGMARALTPGLYMRLVRLQIIGR